MSVLWFLKYNEINSYLHLKRGLFGTFKRVKNPALMALLAKKLNQLTLLTFGFESCVFPNIIKFQAF